MKKLIKTILTEEVNWKEKELFNRFAKSIFKRKFKIRYHIFSDNFDFERDMELYHVSPSAVVLSEKKTLKVYFPPLEEISEKYKNAGYGFWETHSYEEDEDDTIKINNHINIIKDSYGLNNFLMIFYDCYPPKVLRTGSHIIHAEESESV